LNIDEKENPFEGDDDEPLEEMEKVKGSSSSETLAYGENGRPKSTKESNHDIRICDFCGKTFTGGQAIGSH
jgi:hypothetical protein